MRELHFVLEIIQYSIVICWLIGLFLLRKKGTSNEIRIIILKRSVLIAILITINAIIHSISKGE